MFVAVADVLVVLVAVVLWTASFSIAPVVVVAIVALVAVDEFELAAIETGFVVLATLGFAVVVQHSV